MSPAASRIRLLGLVLAVFAAALPLHGNSLEKLSRGISQLERDLLTAAASKTGSYVQQEFETQLSTMNNIVRDMQFKIRKEKISRDMDLVMPLMQLQDCYHKLKQGKERAQRIAFRRTSDSDFRRAKRRALNDINKSDASPEEKKRSIENCYDSWLASVKDHNLRRCSRIKSRLARGYHEEYVVAICELRRLVRQIGRSGKKLK